MSSVVTREQLIDILNYIGSPKIVNKEGKDDVQFCCTIHNERNPSAGFSLEKQKFHCFSCHASGDITWLIYKSLPDQFSSLREVDEWLKDRYGIDFKTFDNRIKSRIVRYEDVDDDVVEEERVVLPRYKLAPYHSGKSTYKYFFKRGFTKKTMKERLIGYDSINRTVTVPVFWEDKSLAGVLGRYIDPDRPKNKRYKIYDFNTGDVLSGMHNVNYSNKTCILCEGLLDELWLWQCGVENAMATLTNSISKTQLKFIRQHFDTIIDFSDCDDMGNRFTETLLKYCSDDFNLYSVKHLYPHGCKDPQDCDPEDIYYMLDNKKPLNAYVKPKLKPYL